GDEAVTYDKMKDTVLGELKRVFNPELLNRLDEVIVFHQLSKNELCKIVDLMLARLQLQLTERKISLTVDENVKDFLINRGFDPTLGARPLRRAIQRYVEDRLAEEVLRGRFTEGGTLRVKLEGDALTFEEVSLLEAPK
ncbi:MAG: ATP-dependent Clp protease ATP-binding subunit, partial [candidate division NC10 bacterium]|nr:ATP-dependent Clp protease ATP-binding subunit [candidate division NC10 bacterium]